MPIWNQSGERFPGALSIPGPYSTLWALRWDAPPDESASWYIAEHRANHARRQASDALTRCARLIWSGTTLTELRDALRDNVVGTALTAVDTQIRDAAA